MQSHKGSKFYGSMTQTNMWELDIKVVDNLKSNMYLELLVED